ncbi:MAG: cysteine--tRNA ligase [Chloroflexi bacterium]|jgi:cysteinyl-tRNA synthetase|nr:cysteine--tRNA ligase [Chloroflexota bacterium]MBT3670529.1 cysteine--tRNA ligase [Chloroflexota bacterium]MBT4002509.1 cysteine--tRNA ligase [Chloroflexota bacterium]MBT4304164.1 cysteine--tRNA ligase [Chloroflexota bacterium]MBT4533477.1 cysteine--tRNA ligase [Chloroflexota bacterium]
MSIRLYNTLTREKEEFKTHEEGKVSLYVCGPTVYDNAHIGHAMSSMVFDIIRRYLNYREYEVRHVMNYTDVDDKIIQRSLYEGVDPIELAERYINQYDQHIKDLNILPATVYPRVTTEMPNIITMISGLIEKDYAYEAGGDVYFRVLQDEDYGKLSRRKLEDMQSGDRIDIDERKESPMDFALWKSAKEGEPSWESPWGLGRPGWHIECSAMSLQHLGEQIDIHGGGNDLIFPHHENEIAQSESFSGKPFSTYWLHNGMVQLSGEKMSKSIGNLVTIGDFLEENDADVLRMMVLNTGYRSPLIYNSTVVEQSTKALERLKNGLRPAFETSAGADSGQLKSLEEQVSKTKEKFLAIMDDDFNSAGALGQLFDLVRMINQARDAGATADELSSGQNLLRELTGVFGLSLEKSATGQAEATPFIDLLIEVRKGLRVEKQWALSDLVRDQLKELGVLLEDNKDGTSWRWE